MACSWRSCKHCAPFGWPATFSWPLMSLRPDMSLGRWLLVACFSNVKITPFRGLIFFQFSPHTQNPFATPRTVLREQKNHSAICRNSERCSYHTDLSRIVRPVSDPSVLNFSQFVGFQNSSNLSKIEKVTETCEFHGKETLFVKRKGFLG